MKELFIAVSSVSVALLVGFILLAKQGNAVANDTQPDRGAVPEVETEHGRISLSAGSTPGIWIASKKSNALICLYVDPTTGHPVIGMYSDQKNIRGGCTFSISCDKEGESHMQLINKDGKVRILQLSQLFDAIQSLDQSVSVGNSNR